MKFYELQDTVQYLKTHENYIYCYTHEQKLLYEDSCTNDS